MGMQSGAQSRRGSKAAADKTTTGIKEFEIGCLIAFFVFHYYSIL
jgi:hypothetical protein